jgi:hypothetical protein
VSWKGKESFYLRDALEVTKGLTTKVFEKSIKELRKPPPSSRCFSIIMRTRTLDLEVELSEEHRKRAQALRRIALANKAGGGSIRGGASVSGSSVGHVDSQEEAEERAMELERDAWVDNLRRIVEAHNNNNNNNATQASSTAATNPAASASTAPSAAASAKPTPAAASPTPVSAAPPAATTAASSLSASAFASPAEPSPRDSPVSGNDEVEVAERGPSGSVFVPLEQNDRYRFLLLLHLLLKKRHMHQARSRLTMCLHHLQQPPPQNLPSSIMPLPPKRRRCRPWRCRRLMLLLPPSSAGVVH